MATTGAAEYTAILPDPERLEHLVDRFAVASGIEADKVAIHASYRFPDGGSDIRSIEVKAIGALVPVAPPISLLTLSDSDRFGGAHLYIHVSENHVSVQADAETMVVAKQIVEAAVDALGLEPYEPPSESRVDELEKRLDAVQALQKDDVRLRCFLSYRFGDSDEVIAAQVERFLRLHDIDVVTGRSYEPRRVEDKVLSRLGQPLDFAVYLLTSSGDSSWLRDEAAQARASRVPVMPLVEDGTEFEQGLFGNVEYILFAPGHVGDVWIALTEAIAFIRANRRGPTPAKPEQA